MRVDAHVSTRELDPVTTFAPRNILRRGEESSTNTLPTKIVAHVHALEFTAPPTRVLQVRKNHHLTHTDDFAVEVRDEYVTATTSRLFNRAPVVLDAVFVLYFGRERTALNHERCGTDVAMFDWSNDDTHA